jgi:hypothetical protein
MLRRTGLLDDVMDVAARLPWGVTVVLATVIHALLHILASLQAAPPTVTRPYRGGKTQQSN